MGASLASSRRSSRRRGRAGIAVLNAFATRRTRKQCALARDSWKRLYFRKSFTGVLLNMTIDQLIDRLKQRLPKARGN